MLRQRAKLVAASVYLGDLILIVIAFFLAYWVRDAFFSDSYGKLVEVDRYLWLLLFIVPTWSFLLYYFRLYRSFRTKKLWTEPLALLKVVLAGTLLLGAAIFVFKQHDLSRLFVVLFGGTAFVFLSVGRIALRVIAKKARWNELNTRNVLLVGTGRRAREIAKVLEDNKDWGFKLLGLISDTGDGEPAKAGGYPVIGHVNQISEILQHQVVDEVIFAVSRKKLEELETIFLMCEELGVRARVAVNFFPHMIAKIHLDDLHGVPLLTFTTTPYNEFLLAFKRSFDLAVSGLLLVALFPLFLLITLTIKLTSKGPVFFKQTRVGLNGRRFTLYKFRSMVRNAEAQKHELLHLNEMDGPVFKMKGDPRLTSIGRFLRKTSLDELPQLINVLNGDMSIVGPRPPLPEEVAQYERWQRRRLSMKPGLTCLWQIHGRSHIVDFNKWMELDLQYIDNWSLQLDFVIFLKTIPVVLLGKGAS
ncbi:MAG TPA: sugar transferase [Nitrospiria bacterium]|nr:sugar transferase [Nitrospiria bacterium]HUK56448.1 sugar transferase [Nitrospiria bacterium]